MRITVLGDGNVGGGLADLWERAGHDVTRLGRDGGRRIGRRRRTGGGPWRRDRRGAWPVGRVGGKTVVDVTNRIGMGAPDGFTSTPSS